MRACPAGVPGKGACARCLSGFTTSGFGRRPERNIGGRMKLPAMILPGVFASTVGPLFELSGSSMAVYWS